MMNNIVAPRGDLFDQLAVRDAERHAEIGETLRKRPKRHGTTLSVIFGIYVVKYQAGINTCQALLQDELGRGNCMYDRKPKLATIKILERLRQELLGGLEEASRLFRRHITPFVC